MSGGLSCNVAEVAAILMLPWLATADSMKQNIGPAKHCFVVYTCSVLARIVTNCRVIESVGLGQGTRGSQLVVSYR